MAGLFQLPVRVSGHNGFGVGKIRRMVRAETEAGPGASLRGEGGEKLRLENPVFMVAALRPRIGKQDENIGQLNGRGKRIEELTGFGFEKEEVGQFRAVAFTAGASDAVFEEVDADAKRVRMRRRISSQVMPMAAADLQRDAGARGGLKRIGQKRFQIGEARIAAGQVIGGANGIFHRAELAEGRAVAEAQSVGRCFYFHPATGRAEREDAFGRRQPLARAGRLKENALPCPIVLSTQTRPP